MATVVPNIRDTAIQLVDQLPENATWDDLQYLIYVRMAIESGIEDADQGRMVSDDAFRKRYGLQP